MKPLSNQLLALPSSATISVSNKAKALRDAGHDMVILAGGDPDFDTPTHIQEAAFAAIRRGDTHYPGPTRATEESAEAIASKYKRDTGVTIDPATQVIITPGGKWALNLALNAIINAGDEVIYLEPVWVSYPPLITLAGGVPVAVSLPSETNFTLTDALLREKITQNTKAMMVTSPNNPTGRVLTKSEVDIIVSLAIEFDLYVIYDELYEQLIYDGKHYPLAAESGMIERTITVNGLSKAYAMTGWRLGWMVASPEIIALAGKLHSQTVTSASSFGMAALTAALNSDHSCVNNMKTAYQARRDFMVSALNDIDGIECRSIQGAFYLFPRFTQTKLGSIALAEYLLTEANVAGTPGIAFGTTGEFHLRFSIATGMNELEKAVERLASVVPVL